MRGLTTERVEWEDPRAAALRDGMEDEMNALYGPLSSSLGESVMEQLRVGLNVLPGTIAATVLAIDGDTAIGQAGLRPHAADASGVPSLEVKKVFIGPEHRGRGASRVLMTALEDAARDLGIRRLVLQTGPLQPAAIALYEKIGYVAIAPYPPYELLPGALCYEKLLN
ncbi:GNAT family N-acetyltransferase [Lacisediminihabitans changchengi]|uniref:GNAT family N-acetyltransferase n=1 Tax=Lacisediminihabitans changchengi TaxID=2787634 RepID=A0A934SQG0_9MICO|nr:GNAT family N-acetyltransferase [Lacisediminihabitans changchengi]MBK4347168.1 GNAT family N-acetyltransferase [Lacisediminihabitans changchengi]